MSLTPKQQKFVDAYLIEPHATKAAMAAGYSAKTADVQGCRLLRNVQIAAAVAAATAKASAKAGVTAEVILGELLRIARADIGEAYDEDGNLMSIKDIPEDVRRAISGLETEELFEGFGREREHIGTTKKVRFWAKGSALEKLGKHLKLFVERHEHSVDLESLRRVLDEETKKPAP